MNTAEDFIILQGHAYQHNKKNFDNRTLQTREIKKFPLFSEHTSYVFFLFLFISLPSLSITLVINGLQELNSSYHEANSTCIHKNVNIVYILILKSIHQISKDLCGSLIKSLCSHVCIFDMIIDTGHASDVFTSASFN